MNRLVLIGNGFDLAHNLPTSYQNFIDWYWENWGMRLLHGMNRTETDDLCTFEINDGIEVSNWAYAFGWYYQRKNPFIPWDPNDVIQIAKEDTKFCNYSMSPFLERITKSIETKGWVDIENEYYELLKKYVLEHTSEAKIDALNTQLHCLQEKLVEYLKSIEISDKIAKGEIRQKIYGVFKTSDISISGQNALQEHIESAFKREDIEWRWLSELYENSSLSKGKVDDYRVKYEKNPNILNKEEPPMELMLPNHIMLLNFNYTHTADLYCKKGDIFTVNQIHGDLNEPKNVIFGYGDELDDNYKAIVNKNENKFLGNIKSIKYLESDNYRKLLSFIESEPFQILIMGHSCGNSDRTLLNTLFEHKNCVSIKPYYRKDKDNYIELVQNISRNFKDMKLMRDRVVNKTYCEPLVNY